MKSFEEVYEAVKNELSESRFIHSEGVKQRCVEFAKLNGIDVEKAKLVGIAHDIAKEIPKEDRIRIAVENGIELDEFEKENTSLIHAKLGAKICKDRFGFDDDMCRAIEAHTTGKKNMNALDKILYLSDCCEPSRNFEGAHDIYEVGKLSLDEGYLLALIRKIEYTLNSKSKIHKDSIDAYNDCLDKKKNGAF